MVNLFNIDVRCAHACISKELPRSGQNDVVATLFQRRHRRRYNVENMVTMKVVLTSFVNVFATSSNDVV